jgi:hypothetical protein
MWNYRYINTPVMLNVSLRLYKKGVKISIISYVFTLIFCTLHVSNGYNVHNQVPNYDAELLVATRVTFAAAYTAWRDAASVRIKLKVPATQRHHRKRAESASWARYFKGSVCLRTVI